MNGMKCFHALTAITLVAALFVGTLIGDGSTRQVMARPVEGDGVLTVVNESGELWSIASGEPPRLLAHDLGHGMEVTALAWNPLQPQVWFARGQFPDGATSLPTNQELVRLDLETGNETLIAAAEHGERYSEITVVAFQDQLWVTVIVQCGRSSFGAMVEDDQLVYHLTFDSTSGGPVRGDLATLLRALHRDPDQGCPDAAADSPSIPSFSMMLARNADDATLTGTDWRARIDSIMRLLGEYRINQPVQTFGQPTFLVGQSDADMKLATLSLEGTPSLQLIPNETGLALSRVAIGTRDGFVAVGTQPPNGYERGHSDVLVVGPDSPGLYNATSGRFGRVTAFAWPASTAFTDRPTR